jgi:predicted nucleic acid-binding protein
MKLVLDAGGISTLAEPRRVARVRALLEAGLWPPVLPTMAMVETLSGNGSRDALVLRLASTSDLVDDVPVGLARRAAELRHRAHRGSAVDALVVAVAERIGTDAVVVTSDPNDIAALAAHTTTVTVHAV